MERGNECKPLKYTKCNGRNVHLSRFYYNHYSKQYMRTARVSILNQNYFFFLSFRICIIITYPKIINKTKTVLVPRRGVRLFSRYPVQHRVERGLFYKNLYSPYCCPIDEKSPKTNF